MVEEYNCFKCREYNVLCPSYFVGEQNKCVYKSVAEHDLKKFRDGRTDLTLISMLEEHLKVKIDVKKLKKK